jgi:hypothetical protein
VRKSTTDCTNLALFSSVEAMAEYFLPPSLHPPMAIITFRSGFFFFRLTAAL